MRIFKTTLLCLALAAPVRADITYSGHDAQGLHCASMFIVVSVALHEMGKLSDQDFADSKIVAALVLDQLPGTKAQIVQAAKQRANKILAKAEAEGSFEPLAKEFAKTSTWCKKNFLH